MVSRGLRQRKTGSLLDACISASLCVFIYNSVVSAAGVHNLADHLNIYSKISCSLMV